MHQRDLQMESNMKYNLCFVLNQLFMIFMLQYRSITPMFLLINEKT